ncbi:energy-coupling factor ABC transporter ATP-binding protein [Atopobacter sp. AH10]|uniref:energy-coupling factor ABC transporter ATP-binding protein n=1 Tax=Atopobacter sp. AH10 TaxID=2315861 RepID=UPI000EF2943A|nr:energy-coupling factor ABC transporter ATP-binding protein [Atopobacter sp. AH10]RLK63823.1 energy-coupling factor ABC transporter ATP-binding protein [Atopobacter sp. AH10]
MSLMIQLDHVKFTYDSAKPLILKDLSLSINEGEWVAIVGPNGSGKSTLAKVIDGLLTPLSGSVTIDGNSLTEENIWEIRSKVGIVFQNPDNQFVGTTVEDDVAFGLENQAFERSLMQERVEKALKWVNMWDFRHHEPARLSGGQKQRVALAGVMALAPKVIILDEATSMLDPLGRREVLETLRQLKAEKDLTVLSITHDIDEAALADRTILLKDGEIIFDGQPEGLFSLGSKLEEYGLDLPYIDQLKVALVKRGIDLPESYLDQEGLVEYLWKLHSRK